MESLSRYRDKRRHPRFFIDLPLDYQEGDHSPARGGIVVNASEAGFLIESVKDIPVGTRLLMAVLFPKGFELADLKLAAEIIWKERHWKEDWEGYQYGLKFVQISDQEHWKLKFLLSGRFQFEELPFYSWHADSNKSIKALRNY